MSTIVKAVFRRCARQFLTRQNPPKNKEMVVLVNEKHSSGTDPELRLSLVRKFQFPDKVDKGYIDRVSHSSTSIRCNRSPQFPVSWLIDNHLWWVHGALCTYDKSMGSDVKYFWNLLHVWRKREIGQNLGFKAYLPLSGRHWCSLGLGCSSGCLPHPSILVPRALVPSKTSGPKANKVLNQYMTGH